MQRRKKTKKRKEHRQVKDRLFRFLIYLAEEYQKLIEQAEESLYGTKQISLPTPKCIVFYNGEQDAPEEQTLNCRMLLKIKNL